jgi:general secretion pathway protein A
MYEKFYGLKERAFNLTPDPSFLYLNQRSREALDHLLYGIDRREGFAVIVGDIGTGKTTLCWALLEKLENKNIQTAMIQNPMLPDTDILRSILQDLGAHPDEIQSSQKTGHEEFPEAFNTNWLQEMNKKQLLDRLNMFLAARARENVFTVIVVDEAQNASLTLLEQLRLLSNLETAKNKLLQIIFVGQLELNEKLKAPEMRQLNQRISIRFETKPLSRRETEGYIRHRLAKAGGGGKIHFKTRTFNTIWHYSKGCPRMINLICDRAFLAAYSERTLLITPKHIRRAARSLNGKDFIGIRTSSGWFGKTVPYMVSALLLIIAVSFIAYQTLAK